MKIEAIRWTFNLRWLCWIGSVLVLAGAFYPPSQTITQRVQKFCFRHFYLLLLMICLAFIGFGFLGKYSQLLTLQLNSQDFWLFVDILEQMQKGAFFLTRFAPQDLGYVQHGIVHPMLSWVFIYPVAAIFGSVFAALLFNPLLLGAAGWMLGLLSQKKWGSPAAILFTLSFFASTQVGKIWMYDTHPEAAYPFFVLLWLWSLGKDGSGQVRWVMLSLATVGCMGVKEDSFLVLLPWIFYQIFIIKLKNKKTLLALLWSLSLAMLVMFFQMKLVQSWVNGSLGPYQWGGRPVATFVGNGYFGGHHWSSLHECFHILQTVFSAHGGAAGVFKKIESFYLSRPWLSLVVLAPWVLFSIQFWITLLPMTLAYSLLDGARLLWNYYSAPLLGSFWFCALDGRKRRFVPAWTFCVACLLGSSSIQIYYPSLEMRKLQNEIAAFRQCLGKQGLVQSHFLPFVLLDKVWIDRIPRSAADWDAIDFAFFSPGVDRFELKAKETEQLFSILAHHKDWVQVGENCKPILSKYSKIVLFVKTKK